MNSIDIKKHYNFSFKKLFTKNTLNYEQKQLAKKAQLFLDSNNYSAYIRMVNEGYQPTKKQKKLLNYYLNKLLSDNSSELSVSINFNEIEKYLENGLRLTYENVFYLLCNTNMYLQICFIYFLLKEDALIYVDSYDKKRESFPLLSKEAKKIINQENFSTFLANLFQKKLTKPYSCSEKEYYQDFISEFYTILTTKPELLFKNTSFEDFLIINKKLQKKYIFDSHKRALNAIVNKLYKNEMTTLLKDTKMSYTSERVVDITISNIKKENYDINDLPTKAVEIIKSIEETYKKIKNLEAKVLSEKAHINLENVEQLDNLLEKRIPEVLSKYLTIDPSYRTSLMSIQGKNAEQLMIESLENIHQSFTQVFEDLNQQSVNSLSVTNRYTQALNY